MAVETGARVAGNDGRSRWWRGALLALMAASLVGCASPGTSQQYSSGMPTERDVAQTAEAKQLLRLAVTDFKRVLAGQRPMYARFKSAPRPGSRIFTHKGYSIADSPLLLAGDDRMFHQAGVTLTLEPPITTSVVSYRQERLVRRSLATPVD